MPEGITRLPRLPRLAFPTSNKNSEFAIHVPQGWTSHRCRLVREEFPKAQLSLPTFSLGSRFNRESIDTISAFMMRYSRSPLLKAGVRALLQDTTPQLNVRRAFATEASLTTPPSAASPSTFEDALSATGPRNTWTKEQIKEIYDTPLMKLAFAAVIKLTHFA